MIDMGQFTDEFVEEWNGKNFNVNGAPINFDGRYGTQCMDLWNYWWTELGIPVRGFPRHVDAAAVWEDFDGAHYTFFDGITPDQPAQKGDVFIYNRHAWGTGYGHIGIVLADNGNSITVLETNGLGDGYEDQWMNQYGSPARIHTWSKENLYGYLRYIQEDNVAFDPGKEWYEAMIKAQARIDEWIAHKGNPLFDRVFGRDVQRYFNPDTLEVRFEPFDGGIPARSTDAHDVISTNNLISKQTNTILDALKELPQVDNEFIENLRKQLSDELREATENLTITFKAEPPVGE